MSRSDLPTTDEQISNMLAGDEDVSPFDGGCVPNWHNRYATLADDLKAAFRDSGINGLVTETLRVAEEVAQEVLYTANEYRTPTEKEVRGTAINVIAVPGVTRNAFVRGAVAEILWEQHLTAQGLTVLDSDEVAARTGVGAYNQERSKGWDVSAETPDGDLIHFQIKATSSEPDFEKIKDADALIWYEIDGGAMLEPEEVTA